MQISMMHQTLLILVVLTIGLPTTTMSAYASNDDDDNNDKFNDPSGCYQAGYDDGRTGPFDSEVYNDNCTGEGRYLDGFIDGCMSVEGNTRDVCESATD